MIYHMSDTLALRQPMTQDYKKQLELALPFAQAWERGEDCLMRAYYSAKFMRAALKKFQLVHLWTDPVK